MTIIASESTAANKNDPHTERMRTVAYNMDMLFPGVYIWCGSVVLKFGGHEPDDSPYRYPGSINSHFGIAVVFPGYKIFTTYKGSYDPR
jgi:hypothetical protein